MKLVDQVCLGRRVSSKKYETAYMVIADDVEKSGGVVDRIGISAGHKHLSDFLVDAQGGHDRVYPFGFGMGEEVFLAESGR